MRSAKPAQTITASHSTSRQLLGRIVMAVFATLALLFTWHPVVVHAQSAPASTPPAVEPAQPPKSSTAKAPVQKDTSTTTHVVKAGETLWSIATRYYGDGHQWRALARRNGIALSSDTAVRIGTKLVIPSKRSVVASASTQLAPRDTTTPRVATTPAAPPLPAPATTGPVVVTRPSGALAAQTTGKANASATAPKRVASGSTPPKAAAIPRDSAALKDTTSLVPRTLMRPQIMTGRLLTNGRARIGLIDASDVRAARPAGESATVFLLKAPDAGELAASVRQLEAHAEIAPRRGEYISAPFPMAEVRWASAGRLVRRLDDARATAEAAQRMQLADQVEITAPTGMTLRVGDQLVAVHRGGLLTAGFVVAVPSAIVQVTRAEAGRPVQAYVRSVTGVLGEGDALVALEGSAAAPELRTEAVSDMETQVSWIDAGELLPTLQSYVLLGAGQAQGVKAGEMFALVRKSTTGVGEDRIAVVRVVRVSPSGSTAVVIRQQLPEIASGMKARRIARVP
jgi:LysM repeat protein